MSEVERKNREACAELRCQLSKAGVLLITMLMVGTSCGEALRCEPGANESRELGEMPSLEAHKIIATTPSQNSVSSGVEILVDFEVPISNDVVLEVSGEHTGPVVGELTLSERGIRFAPSSPLMAGEHVTARVRKDATAEDGTLLAPHGFAWQFHVAVTPSASALSAETLIEVERHSTEGTPGNFSQTYGGSVMDLNRDGYPDIVLVNEHSDDAVSFRNIGDGLGRVERVAGTVPTGHGPSPSEAADLDGDGYVDLAVSNTRDDIVSLYRGGPAGTLTPWRDLPTGCQPRGIVLIDVNGDGTEDVVTADFKDNAISIHVNQGDGSFLVRTVLETPEVDGDWAIGAGDLDNDGILDLVVGGHDDGSIMGFLGRGEGHFVPGPRVTTPIGLWHLNVADLSGDGIVDIAVAGGHSGKGSLILSTTRGVFGEAETYLADPGNASTDLGDLDGDGDLDWVLSSFSTSDSDWNFFENDGLGGFEKFLEVDSPEDASCCLLVDLDRDGDLDAALIDEADDVMIILHNK